MELVITINTISHTQKLSKWIMPIYPLLSNTSANQRCSYYESFILFIHSHWNPGVKTAGQKCCHKSQRQAYVAWNPAKRLHKSTKWWEKDLSICWQCWRFKSSWWCMCISEATNQTRWHRHSSWHWHWGWGQISHHCGAKRHYLRGRNICSTQHSH